MKDILTAPFVKEMCDTTANMYRLGWDEMVVISAICLMKKKLHNILILIMC